MLPSSHSRIIAPILLVLLSSAARAEEKTMYVTRANAKLLSDKKLSSPPVATLKQGDAVTVVDGGNFLFHKVKTPDGKNGFIPYTSVSEKNDSNLRKIFNSVKGITKPEEQTNNESRVRTTNAVMGIRGLNATPEEQLSSVSNARPNMKAVYTMEEFETRESDVTKLADAVMGELERAAASGLSPNMSTVEPPPAAPPAETFVADDYRAEVEVGRVMAGRLLATFGVAEETRATGYLSVLGNYVAQNSDFGSRRYMFAITTDDEISAYSCPGGYILVSKGAILAAKNEAELAGVLAHEIAHVGRKHILAAVRSDSGQQKSDVEAELDKDPVLRARKRVKPDADSAAGASIARYLSGPNGTTISVLAAAASGLQSLFTTGLKPEVEYEADKDALVAMMRSGYDGRNYINYIRELGRRSEEQQKRAEAARQQKKGGTAVLSKTHPAFDLRIAKLEEALARLKNQMPAYATGTERYKRSMLSAIKTNPEEKAK
jgi:Zn-dependent protease with chaperone function